MSDALAKRWQIAFFNVLNADAEHAAELREASLIADLKRWTTALSITVVRAFEELGLVAAAKGHVGKALPVPQQEYLGQDVMAFSPGPVGWRFPIAVCELENAADDERVGYSLWKTLCVRAQLRVIFCYRRDGDRAPALVRDLADSVISPIPITDRTTLDGATIVTVGFRSDAGTFPYGFFESWKLNSNTGRFERFPRS
jgi:hypothetical protein